MRVSRIEIFGFKSFMDRTVLSLGGGLTGVVGPNGCGKSNIVDAVRWVLGETRAKSLRGANFEDVIFNGTDKLRPLGLAEVTLTVKAKSESFFDEMLPSLLNDEVAESLANIDEVQKELDKVMPLEKEVNLKNEALKDEVNDNSTPRLSVVVDNTKPKDEVKKEEQKENEETVKIVQDLDTELEDVMKEAGAHVSPDLNNNVENNNVTNVSLEENQKDCENAN